MRQRSRHIDNPRRQAWPFAGTGGAVLAAAFLLILLSVLSTLCTAQSADGEGTTRRVVILNSTDPYLPAFLALDSALRSTVREQSSHVTEFYAESLDMHRFPRDLLDQDLVSLLRKKYVGLKVDVVATTASIALDFAQRHLAEIWPGAVVVFNSVTVASFGEQNLDPRTIGIPVRLEFRKTLDLALQLRPATRRIAVVAGSDEPCCGRLSRLQKLFEPYAERFEVQYLVGLTLADMLAAVRALPVDSVVLYLSMFRDGAGVPHVPRDVLERIAAVSPAPVFGLFETYLGHGTLAGSIASFEAQGRRTGELVARVLNGEDPVAIGVQAPVDSGCIADWGQLRHWRIDEGLLPEGCEIRFREVTAWDRYRLEILTVLVVILAQTAMIVTLVLHRRRLRQAQVRLTDESARRSRAEALAARLRGRLARFSKERSLGVMATAISHEINQPLIAIQNYAQAARRRLQSDTDATPKLLELFAKIEGQAQRAGDITQRVRSLVSRKDPQLRPTQLGQLLREVIRMLESETESRGCRIACETAEKLPTVRADALQIQLVLVNLLQNALQAICSSDRYEKRVSIDLRAIDIGEVQVSVIDRGSGVATDRLADIFEPLYSGNGGMGMGLAISKAIIEAHGGSLWYEPNPDGGAIFRFTLQAVAS